MVLMVLLLLFVSQKMSSLDRQGDKQTQCLVRDNRRSTDHHFDRDSEIWEQGERQRVRAGNEATSIKQSREI